MVAKACAIALALCLGACSSSDEVGLERSIGPAHRSQSKPRAEHLFASSAERFGMALPGASSSESFTYSAPADWIDRPLTEMRAVRLQVGESATDECTVTVLDGDGGGALANINRWCGQINAKPWMQAQLDSAPRISMFKAEALLVTLGEENSPRMVLGALARMGTSSVFVKFAGARETVLARRQDFETFCTSLAQKP